MDSHKLYSYRYADGRYTVSIANRACVEEAIAALCRDLDIRSAAITGIGAVDEATLRFYNPATKRYVDRRFEEQMEIASLTGNVSQMDGKCYLHLHVTLGRATIPPWRDTCSRRASTARARSLSHPSGPTRRAGTTPSRDSTSTTFNSPSRTARTERGEQESPSCSLSFIPHNNSRLRQRHEDNRNRY